MLMGREQARWSQWWSGIAALKTFPYDTITNCTFHVLTFLFRCLHREVTASFTNITSMSTRAKELSACHTLIFLRNLLPGDCTDVRRPSLVRDPCAYKGTPPVSFDVMIGIGHKSGRHPVTTN